MSDLLVTMAKTLVVKALGVNKHDPRRGYIVLGQRYLNPVSGTHFISPEFPILSFWRSEKGSDKPTTIELYLRELDVAPGDEMDAKSTGVKYFQGMGKPDGKGNRQFYDNFSLESVGKVTKDPDSTTDGWRSIAGIPAADEKGGEAA